MATFEESSLSSWAGPYVTEMLGRGQATASQPYTAYGGPLTAGQSGLQQQAFQGLSGLTAPTSQMGAYTPQSFTGAGYTAPSNQYQGPKGSFQQDRAINFGGPSGLVESQRDLGTGLAQTRFGNLSPLDPAYDKGQHVNANPLDYDSPQVRTTALPGGPSGLVERPARNHEFTYPDWLQRNPQPPSVSVLDGYTGDLPTRDSTQQRPLLNSPVADRGITSSPAADSTVERYMSPYLEGALQPQYDAANRQSQIQRQEMQSRYGKAGAYGGSRQAVAGAELDRGLLDRMSDITGTGYQNAFEQAQKQFNTEQDRQMTAQQRTNQYGLDVLGAQQDAGGLQRAIEGQGIAADYAQFQEERDYDKNNTLYMQSLLQGLPLETQTYSYTQPSGLQNVAGGVQDITNILDLLSGNSSSEAVAPEFQSLVDFYVSQGRTPEQAANDANAILGTG